MVVIKILKVFVQVDTNMSLQRELSQAKTVDDSKKQTYEAIVKIADKIKFKTALSQKERFLAARYFRTLKNEISGKTMRYDSTVDNNKDWVFI